MKIFVALMAVVTSTFSFAQENIFTLKFVETPTQKVDLIDFKIDVRFHYVSPRKNTMPGPIGDRFNFCRSDIVFERTVARSTVSDTLGFKFPFILKLEGNRRFCNYTLVRLDFTIINPTVYQAKDFMKYYWPGENIQKFGWNVRTLVAGETKVIDLDCRYRTRFEHDPRLAFRCKSEDLERQINSQYIDINPTLISPPIK